MSKLVDDAVSDYFSLLLTDTPTESVELQNQSAIAEPIKQDKKQAQSETREYAIKERVSHQALEQLLAPVAKAELEAPAMVSAPATTVVTRATAQTTIIDEDSPAPILKGMAETPEPKVSAKVYADDKRSVAGEPLLESNTAAAAPPNITKDLVEQLDDEFQVLFFKVAGLTLAVPLVSLGGIVNIEKLTPLIGRPKWYKGVQQHRGSQLNVVDTCAWVMPEKYDQPLADSVDYQYVVVLEDSAWGLSCEALVDTVTMKKSQINWGTQAGKRPWLAGVVKEQMCGMLNVGALVQMLNAGLGYQDHIEPSLALP